MRDLFLVFDGGILVKKEGDKRDRWGCGKKIFWDMEWVRHYAFVSVEQNVAM